jgi:hypothetical protein
METETACMAALTVAVLALGATAEAQLPGLFPASELRRPTLQRPVLPGTGREQGGGLALEASRPW